MEYAAKKEGEKQMFIKWLRFYINRNSPAGYSH